MSDLVKEVSSADFQSVVLQSERPVVVDFWAPWCGPCRMVAPEIEKLAQRYGDSVTVVKLNVDDSGDVAGRYGVMSIPTIGLFRAGAMVSHVVGARGADQLAKEFGLA